MKKNLAVIGILTILFVVILATICCSFPSLFSLFLDYEEKNEDISDGKYFNWKLDLGAMFNSQGLAQDNEKVYVLGELYGDYSTGNPGDYNEKLNNCDDSCLVVIDKKTGEIDTTYNFKGYPYSYNGENKNITINDKYVFVNIYNERSMDDSMVYRIDKISGEIKVVKKIITGNYEEMVTVQNYLIIVTDVEQFFIDTESLEVIHSKREICGCDLKVTDDRYVFYKNSKSVIKIDINENFVELWDIEYPGEEITNIVNYYLIGDIVYVTYANNWVELYSNEDGHVISGFLLDKWEDASNNWGVLSETYPQVDSTGHIFYNAFSYQIVDPNTGEEIFRKSWDPNFSGCEGECFSLGVKNAWYLEDYSVINYFTRDDLHKVNAKVEIVNNKTGEISQVYESYNIADGAFNGSNFIGLNSNGDIVSYSVDKNEEKKLGEIFFFQETSTLSMFTVQDDSSIYFLDMYSSELVSFKKNYSN